MDSLKERVYRHIRDRMLVGAIAPGQRVSETQLAKEVGVSRTPVREALVRLEALGLIEQHTGLGTIVCEPDRQEIEECFELREILECGAVALAAQRVTEVELTHIETGFAAFVVTIEKIRASGPDLRRALNEANIMDMSFHLDVMAAAHNNRLVRMVSDLQLLTRILRRRPDTPGDSASQRSNIVVKQHRRIIDALQNHAPAEAVEAMRVHLEWAKETHLAAFDWFARNAAPARSEEQFWPRDALKLLNDMESQAGTTGSGEEPVGA